MARDIEEFLRKAAERRKQKQGGGAPAPQPQRPAQQPPQSRQPPRAQPPQSRQPPRPQPPRRPPPQQAPVEPVIVLDQADIVEKSRLSTTFKSSIDTSSISQHADGLGKGVRSAAQRLDSNVSQHLDHNVGRISETGTVTDDPEPKIVGAKNMTMADELLKLLRSKKSVGQAIILSEILKRPDFD